MQSGPWEDHQDLQHHKPQFEQQKDVSITKDIHSDLGLGQTCTMRAIAACDLIITMAYFSIPFQILISLWKSPPDRKIPTKLVVTLVLFAFFIFLCGTGHLMRYLDLGHTTAFIYVHVATALVSSITALYLIPLIPCMFSILDESLNKLTKETQESKSHLFTFMAFLCHELRYEPTDYNGDIHVVKPIVSLPLSAYQKPSLCHHE